MERADADDLFTSFAAAPAASLHEAEAPPPATAAGALLAEMPHNRRRGHPQAALAQAQPASPFARLPMVTWLLLAGAALVIVTAMLYYWRRRHTTQGREREDKQALGEALRALTAQVNVLEQQQESVMQQQTVLAQQHNTLAGQLRSVAAHSRSVEQGLGQALDSWTATIQQLREEFELLVEEDDGAEAQQPAGDAAPAAIEQEGHDQLEAEAPARE